MTEAVASATSTTATTTTAAQGKAEEVSAADKLSSDFETFLVMLTTQLENQDPLNPTDSADFALQLATFSGVEQQVKTNDLLVGLNEQVGAMGMSDLASWVGMEARVEASLEFAGEPITVIPPERPEAAETAKLVVRDSSGAIVDQSYIEISEENFDWDGAANSGDVLDRGTYDLTIEYFDKDGAYLETKTPEIYTLIKEAQNSGGGVTQLVLAGGAVVDATDIAALRTVN